MPINTEELKDKIIISYSLSQISQKQKVKFLRELFGYKERKRKIYSHKGLLDEINGEKLGSNVVMINVEHLIKINELFNEYKIKPNIIEVWSR